MKIAKHNIVQKNNLTVVGKHVLTIQNRVWINTDSKIISKYDQEIPQSQTADNPIAPRGRAAQPSRDAKRQIKQSNQLSLPHQDDCNTRMDIK